jgi:CRP/FNR family transcriptional regulator
MMGTLDRSSVVRLRKECVMSLAVAISEMPRPSTYFADAKSTPCESCPARALSICGAIERGDLSRLAASRATQRVKSGETLVDEGEPATHFLNIISGSVKVYKLMPDGRRQVTGFLFPGDLLGLAFNDAYTYSAEALTPVTVCRFPRRQLERLLDEFPKFEKRLLAIASNELAAAQEQMMLLGRKTAQERVASFLLALASRAERSGKSADSVTLTMTRTDIADYLGLTTETTSRVFTALRKRGAIELGSCGRVDFADSDVLEELASGLE